MRLWVQSVACMSAQALSSQPSTYMSVNGVPSLAPTERGHAHGTHTHCMYWARAGAGGAHNVALSRDVVLLCFGQSVAGTPFHCAILVEVELVADVSSLHEADEGRSEKRTRLGILHTLNMSQFSSPKLLSAWPAGQRGCMQDVMTLSTTWATTLTPPIARSKYRISCL